MTTKYDKLFATHFVEVIHQGLLNEGFKLLTNDVVANVMSSVNYHGPVWLEQCNQNRTEASAYYIKRLSDEVFGVINWDLRPRNRVRGFYICNLSYGLSHLPTHFLVADLTKSQASPFVPIVGNGILGQGLLNRGMPYDSKLSADELTESASEVLTALQNEIESWIEASGYISVIEKALDEERFPSFRSVCFYISIGRKAKARARMTECIRRQASHIRKLLEVQDQSVEQSQKTNLSPFNIAVIDRLNELTQE